MRAWVQKTMDEACTHDGVEAVVSLTDPGSGKGLAINFFRDQAALDAFEEFSRQKHAESQERSGTSDGFTGDHVYTDVVAAQAASQ
jgi:hypothetical protein